MGEGDKLAQDEDTKVKITSNETKIDMEKEKKEVEAEGFKGLSKDELMQYANDPFWVRLRWVLFILFWVIWVAMLAASIAIIVYTPKCPSPEPKVWWQKGPVYKASVKDFPDVDNDGQGDLKGMKESADYLVSAWVGTVYFSNLLNRHDLETVAQEHGSMEDWKDLVTALQDRNIRVMVEMDPTSTSEQHLWYEEFKSGNNPNYTNFYEATGSTKLNLANDAVVKKLEEVTKFWLQNGVDGIVVRETVPRNLLERLRGVMDQEQEASGKEKVLVFEGANAEGAGGNYTGVGAGDPVHLVVGGDILGEGTTLTAPDLKTKIDDFMSGLPCKTREEENKEYCLWPAFSISTTGHDHDMMDALTMLKMLLPGTMLTQAGEELGLDKLDVTKAEDEGVKKHLELYRLLAEGVRGQDAILYGEMNVNNTIVMNNDTVFGLTRVKKGSPGYVLLINLANENVTVNLSDVANIPESVRVLERYQVMAVSPREEEEWTKFASKAVTLTPRQAKIFNFVPKFKD